MAVMLLKMLLSKQDAYAKEIDIPVFAMDDNLYIENIKR